MMKRETDFDIQFSAALTVVASGSPFREAVMMAEYPIWHQLQSHHWWFLLSVCIYVQTSFLLGRQGYASLALHWPLVAMSGKDDSWLLTEE